MTLTQKRAIVADRLSDAERFRTGRKRMVEIPMPRVRAAIVSRFRAGDTVALLAWDYGYTRRGIEFCLRESLTARRGKR